ACDVRICLHVALHLYSGTTNARYSYLPASPLQLAYYQSGSHDQLDLPEGITSVRCLASLASAWAHSRGYGNINPLSIDYACRPRLRSRLTLGGLACPRNPWSFGGGLSHPSFATHDCILTRVASTAGSLRCFPCHTTLPYPPAHLDPKGARGHGTSRTLASQGRPGPPSSLTAKGRDNTRMPQLRRCA